MIKSIINKLIFIPLGLIIELLRAFYNRLRLQLFYNRSETIKIFAGHDEDLSKNVRPKVLAVITHVFAEALTGIKINPSDNKNSEKIEKRIEKLTKTIDALFNSFAHCDLHIIINTIKDMNLIEYLPKNKRELIHVIEQTNCEPLFVEFKAQDEFIKRINDFDWFLFLEDDILINDSCFLDKLEFFNKYSANERAILLPHRYEMLEQNKIYIDKAFSKENVYLWNKLSVFNIGNLKFAEFQNPHAAMYCLSKKQLETWIKSGRRWYNKTTFVGPQESAQTGCLSECFRIYKPHLSNTHFFEVQHWDTYYSKRIFKKYHP